MNRSLLQELDPRNHAPLLARLLAIADDAVIVADAAQRIVLFNEGAERVFGYRLAEVLGQPLAMLLPEPARAAHAGHLRAFAQSALPARRMAERRDIHGRRADGVLFDAEASISHVELDGQTYFAAILRDVSESRQARRALERAKAEAEAAERAKSLFLANMSHEIRTPLNAVIGMTTLLMDTPMSDEQLDFARTIRASGETLLGVINDILDFSKADVGKLEIEQQRFDLRRCVEDALDLVAPRALEKRLNLAYLIEDGTPENLVGDVTRIRQILANLLSNAVKFTHQGEVLVIIDSEPVDAGDGPLHRIHFAVQDSGIGIAAEHLPRLFQSFTQVDASTTRKYGGTGLGLAISKRLAELMGGTVSVQSEPGQGSVFRVSVLARAAEAPEPADFLQRNVPALVGKRLLIVDDNLTNRRILTRMAMLWGMLPSTLPSALEALDRIRHGERYDAAVLDMSLPGIDGLELAVEIRRRRSAEELPIVMLTSLGQRHALADEQRAGLAAFLSKPIKASALFATLVAVVQGRQRAAPAGPAPGPQPLAASLPLRVLVAEDNAVNQRVALRLLQRLGYQADVAANGLEVIEAVERQAYSVVLMDIQMPEMDGLQAARWIRQRRGPQGLPRIIAMTANAMPGDREAYLAAGMDGYVAKPIEPDELAAALRRAGSPAGGTVAPGGAAASRTPADDTVLDALRLEHLRTLQDDGQPSLVRELIDLFVADAPGHVDALAQALQGTDARRLASLAHRFLSVTDNIGARRLSALCVEIERLARRGELDGLERLVEALSHEHAQAHAALLAVRTRY
ncbi:multi-sensor hybrid histidine kinase [Leptothrix cholodnii SP-6]|uniref:histidine kinase n=1 Tax=Leptothrix cholodnii (strain ATCC 51168 / LMG 8142 / SP-6) TaxID=395495 RepID=B1XXP6_LEPCP|nr:response regulator [Leptothrix cholodnii]ACB36365.1 multi-sensor hybrid histidine kinase [Leptothrix cholodnii SP-6]